jgi:hypothetical protein
LHHIIPDRAPGSFIKVHFGSESVLLLENGGNSWGVLNTGEVGAVPAAEGQIRAGVGMADVSKYFVVEGWRSNRWVDALT